MSLELWKSIFDWLTVILIALTVFSGAGALITGDRISKKQEARLHDFETNLTDAKTVLGTQQERAAKAELALAGLQKEASDAKAAQQRVETELAKQQERAANAERDAAEAKLELEDFRTPRSIQDPQGFGAEMKAFSGQKFSYGVAQDQEAFAFAIELKMTLNFSGWVLIPPQSGSAVIDLTGMGDVAGIGNGIGVYVEYAHHPSNGLILRARTLVSALEKHGISAKEATSAAIGPDTLNIFVGEKPGRWQRPKLPAKKP